MSQIYSIFEESNRRDNPNIDGLSRDQFYGLLYDTFEPESMLSLSILPSAEYNQIPLLNQVRYFLELISQLKEIKLTKTGSLPVKIVRQIYDQRFILDEHIESGVSKLSQEMYCPVIHLTRILCELMGVTKKRNGKLSLTKLGEKSLNNPSELFSLLFQTFARKFNWAYFDGYTEHPIGQFGMGYSLYLLGKYGNQTRESTFYSEMYFRALPDLKETIEPSLYSDTEDSAHNCYTVRTFERFLVYFGVVEVERTNFYPLAYNITKRALFDKIFVFDV